MYRRSQHGRHAYCGFPLILAVSTNDTAEQRLITAAERARSRFGEDLPLATTTTMRLRSSGIFGPIWRYAGSRVLSGLSCGLVSRAVANAQSALAENSLVQVGGREPGLIREPGKIKHLDLTGMND